MSLVDSQTFQKGGFTSSQPYVNSFFSKAEIIEKLCEEILLLEKDYDELKKHYNLALKHFNKLHTNLIFPHSK